MATNLLPNAVARQEWLEPVAKELQNLLHRAFASGGKPGRKIKNVLHGTWLGHPLHVILTDIPLGGWTAAMVFDALELATSRREFQVAADTAVAIGLVGAAGAAVSGLTDFQDIDPPATRIGVVHGLLNVTAASLFLASLVKRRAKARSAGRRFGLLGFLVGASAAFLGGALVYDEGVGVDHTLGQSFPKDFTSVLSESELLEGELKRVDHLGVPILLVKRGDQIFAVAETCSHLGGPLSEGKLIGNGVQCPWHASQFSLEDGRVLDGPAVHPLPCLEVQLNNGQIEVRTPKPKENSAGTTGATVPRPEAA